MHSVWRGLCFLFCTLLHLCYAIFVQSTCPQNKQHRFCLYLHRFIEINRSELLISRSLTFFSISDFVDFCVEWVHIVCRVLCFLFFAHLYHYNATDVQFTTPHNKQHRFRRYLNRFHKPFRITHFSCSHVFVHFCVECVHSVCRVLCILFFTFLHYRYAICALPTRSHNTQHRFLRYLNRLIEINRAELLIFRALIFLSISVVNRYILFVEFSDSYLSHLCINVMLFV